MTTLPEAGDGTNVPSVSLTEDSNAIDSSSPGPMNIAVESSESESSPVHPTPSTALSSLANHLDTETESTVSSSSYTDSDVKSQIGESSNANAPTTIRLPVITHPQVSSSPRVEADDKRYCWVCFASDEDDLTATWVKPCRCRGTTKWVHQVCIQRWIDEKQKGNATAKVSCPQCNTEYYIFYPTQGALVVIMDSLDALISRVCPFVAAGIVVGSIYWTAVTYGAVTVMQVAGHKEGLSVMEQADPLVLLVGLPTIPVMLILGKMIRWEDQVLRFIRKYSWRIPLLRHILPAWNPPSALERSVSQDVPPLSDPVSATRILCGALLLPTVASVFGKVLFENVRSNFKRAILGGVAFIAIKGMLRIYHKQQQYVRTYERKIMDFHNEASTNNTGSTAAAAVAENGSPPGPAAAP